MGQGLRTSRCTVNSLNQYTQRTVPGAVDVLGEAAADAVVTVNDQEAERHGGYYRKELRADKVEFLNHLSAKAGAAPSDWWRPGTKVSSTTSNASRNPTELRALAKKSRLLDKRW